MLSHKYLKRFPLGIKAKYVGPTRVEGYYLSRSVADRRGDNIIVHYYHRNFEKGTIVKTREEHTPHHFIAKKNLFLLGVLICVTL